MTPIANKVHISVHLEIIVAKFVYALGQQQMQWICIIFSLIPTNTCTLPHIFYMKDKVCL